MADMTGFVQASSNTENDNDESGAENEPDKPSHGLSELMCRLRARASQQPRHWNDTTKALRMAITDKRHVSEILDKLQLQKHLERLQKVFKVTSVVGMVERLEMISRTCALKCLPTQNGHSVYISCESFYVEITMVPSSSAVVQDVCIVHNASSHTESVGCPEMVKCLCDGDFEEFASHLEGLVAMYKINAEKKHKNKAFLALQSLELDLNNLAQLQSSINSVSNYIHKSPLGILLPRIGGIPMKLIYFVGPYDLLDEQSQSAFPMTVEAITDRKVGHSVTVGIERCSHHKLQVMPLMTVSKAQDGKSLPSFSGLSNANTSVLPAVFVLQLQRPVPVALSVVEKIQATTGVELLQLGEVTPLMSLLVHMATKGKKSHLDPHQPFYVNLPDMKQCYYMNCVNGTGDLQGMMVSQVPFSHPTHVPKILNLLRQQVMFNTAMSSCIRLGPKPALEKMLTFEVSPLSLQQISVTFEHPIKEGIATAEFDLVDLTNVRCRIFVTSSDEDEPLCPDDYACKVMQRCLSIPITMRAILQKATRDILMTLVEEPAPAPVLSKTGQERRKAFVDSHTYRYSSSMPEQISANTGNFIATAPYPNVPRLEGMDTLPPMDTSGMPAPDIMEAIKDDRRSKNPMLASLLDQLDTDSPPTSCVNPPQNSMLSALLSDQASVPPNPHIMPTKRKQKKRRSTSEKSDSRSPGASGRSPTKRKYSEDDFGRDTSMGDIESNSNSSFDGSVVTTPISSLPTPVTISAAVNVAAEDNFTSPGDSHVSRLANSLDNLLKKETKVFPPLPTGAHLQVSSGSINPHPELSALLSDPSTDNGGDFVPKNTVKVKEEGVKSSNSQQTHTIKREDRLKGTKRKSLDDTMSSIGSISDSFDQENLPAQDGPATPIEPNSKNSSGFSSAKSNVTTPAHDPFDFNAEIIKNESARVETLPKRTNSLDMEVDEIDVSVSQTANSQISKYDMRAEIKEGKPKDKEKKKELKESRTDSEDRPRDKESQRITVKLNTKDFTAKTIVKSDSPVFENSPVALDLSRTNNKEHKHKDSKGHRSIGDRTPDYSVTDTEVSQITSSSINKFNSDSSHTSSTFKKSKSESSNSSYKSDKKRRSKHSDGDVKRKREDGKKDKTGKKRKLHDSNNEWRSEKYSHSSEVNQLKPTTIKITTTAEGKRQFSTNTKHVSINPLTGSKSPSTKTLSPAKLSVKSDAAKSSPSPQTKSNTSKSLLAISGKTVGRSKSESNAYSKIDSKLSKTPTIKLKPLVMPMSNTVNVTSTSSSKNVSLTAPAKTTSSSSSCQASRSASIASANAASKGQIRARKGSLSAIVEKLSKQQSTGPKDGDSFPVKKDPVSQKDKFDAIRRQIVQEGTKPSTPTRELGITKTASTAGSIPSFKKISQTDASANKNDSKKSDTSSTTSSSILSSPSSSTQQTFSSSGNSSNSSTNLQNSSSKSSSQYSQKQNNSANSSSYNSGNSSKTNSSSGSSSSSSFNSSGSGAKNSDFKKVSPADPRTETRWTNANKDTSAPSSSKSAASVAKSEHSAKHVNAVSGSSSASSHVNSTNDSHNKLSNHTPSSDSSHSVKGSTNDQCQNQEGRDSPSISQKDSAKNGEKNNSSKKKKVPTATLR